MSSSNNSYIIGASGNPVDSTLAGQNINESYLALKNPPRVQLSNSIATQLPNCPCGYVTISNPLGNDVVFVGGLDGSNDTPYLDPNYPGQGRGQPIYPGTSQIFRVVNSNLLQAIANRNNDVINVIPHLSQSDFITPSGDPPANPQYSVPLAVVLTSPLNGATSVPSSTVAEMFFNRSIDPASATSTNFVISPAVVTAIVYVDPLNAAQVNVDPQGSNLLNNTTYTVTAGVNVKDLLGIKLLSPSSFSFTTAAVTPPDTTPPTVSSVNPTNGATGVSLSVDPVVVMSEAVQSSTVTTANVQLLDPNSAAVATTVSLAVDNETITITPTVSLSQGSTYTIKVSGIKDLAGNVMSSTFTSTFTTTSTFTQFYNSSGSTAVTIGSSFTYYGIGERVVNTSSILYGHIPRKVVCTLAVTSNSAAGTVYCRHLDNNGDILDTLGSVQFGGGFGISTTPATYTFEDTSNTNKMVVGHWIGVHTFNVFTYGVKAYTSSSNTTDGSNSVVSNLRVSDGSFVNGSADWAATAYE